MMFAKTKTLTRTELTYFCFVLLSLSFAGCVSMDSADGVSRSAAQPNATYDNLSRVSLGMSRKEVMLILGDSFKIGYKQDNPPFGTLEAITQKQPYREEQFTIKNKTYDVLYFYTQTVKADDIVSNEELTPLVFLDDKLIGKTWDFLFKLKNNP